MSKLDPITKYKLEKYCVKEDAVMVGTMAVSALVAMLVTLLSNISDTERKRIKRKCKKYKGKERKICQYQELVNLMNKYLSKIREYKGRCSKTTEPKRCVQSLNKREAKVKAKIAKLENKIRELKK